MSEHESLLNKEVEILIRKNETLKDEIALLQLKNDRLNAQINLYKEMVKG